MGSVVNLSVFILSLFSLTLNNAAQNIEKAFLQNNPAFLYSLLSQDSYMNVSIPDPIAFSDQVSNQQALFLFKRIFKSYSTFEFYSDREPTAVGRNSYIFKARWSFQDRKDSKHVLFIFFYMMLDPDARTGPSRKGHPGLWEITEIRAVKF